MTLEDLNEGDYFYPASKIGKKYVRFMVWLFRRNGKVCVKNLITGQKSEMSRFEEVIKCPNKRKS